MTDRESLRKLIEEQVVILDYTSEGQVCPNYGRWIFDFRKILLQPHYLELMTCVLYEQIKDQNNIQIGGLESAAIPLITSLVLYMKSVGKTVNGFYIRKSRKKSGLYKIIEGDLNKDPIVLIDDLMNSSNSFIKQIRILESQDYAVKKIITIVRFRELKEYADISSRNIDIVSIFSLVDFPIITQLETNLRTIDRQPYKTIFVFQPMEASHYLVIPRSTPCLYRNLVMFGADDGYFRALDKYDGTLRWQIKMGSSSQGKSILSSPVVYDGIVFFGSYDGKLYALNADIGKCKWTFSDCEWIGSSPAVSIATKQIVIGLEHGSPIKKGSVVALDMNTGEKNWEYFMPALTHASPLVLDNYNQVLIGGNEGVLYSFDLKDGSLQWKFETEGGKRYIGQGGFSPGDIKMTPVFDSKNSQIAFSSMDGTVYVLDRESGLFKYRVESGDEDIGVRVGIFNSPCFTEKHLIFAGLDKTIYCCDVISGDVKWKYKTGGRVFAAPVVRNSIVYIGSNDGVLYELTENLGQLLSTHQFSDRLVCPVVFDEESNSVRLYLMAHGATLFAVERPDRANV